jgi:hypothetical protein
MTENIYESEYMDADEAQFPGSCDKIKIDLVLSIFFGQIKDNRGMLLKSKSNWTCLDCGMIVVCDLCHGKDKLYRHIDNKHASDWQGYLEDKLNKRSILFGQTTNKAKEIYGHIDHIISNNLPYNYVENSINRLYLKLPKISRQTIAKYVIAMAEKTCEKVISNYFPCITYSLFYLTD